MAAATLQIGGVTVSAPPSSKASGSAATTNAKQGDLETEHEDEEDESEEGQEDEEGEEEEEEEEEVDEEEYEEDEEEEEEEERTSRRRRKMRKRNRWRRRRKRRMWRKNRKCSTGAQVLTEGVCLCQAHMYSSNGRPLFCAGGMERRFTKSNWRAAVASYGQRW